MEDTCKAPMENCRIYFKVDTLADILDPKGYEIEKNIEHMLPNTSMLECLVQASPSQIERDCFSNIF